VLVPSWGEVHKGCTERFESEVVGEVSAQLGNVPRGYANLTDPGDGTARRCLLHQRLFGQIPPLDELQYGTVRSWEVHRQ
jgi:hypothetical protein